MVRYLDTAASTPVAPEVAELVLRLMTSGHGNAGSRTHAFGLAASRELALARERCASVAGCDPAGVLFTSGATEANNIAIGGVAALGRSTGRRHVVATSIEHKAVLEPLARLAEDGFEVSCVDPDGDGRVDAGAILAAVREDTLLVSVMDANNETGAVQPVAAIADGLREGPILHVDAAQTFAKRDGGYRHPRVDMVVASGHKVFAPMGIGLLGLRRPALRRDVRALTVGGGQERGLRAGTVPVPLAAGFGLAVELAWSARDERTRACGATRALALRAFSRLGPVVLGGADVLPHILSIGFPGLDSEALMVSVRDLIAISNGSACTSSSYAPSHVLAAMGLDERVADSVVRMSWSHEDPGVPWDEVAARVSAMLD